MTATRPTEEAPVDAPEEDGVTGRASPSWAAIRIGSAVVIAPVPSEIALNSPRYNGSARRLVNAADRVAF
ncbi:hypothetical protein MGN01_33500 [Methylobacterium gnaphalii]|uniref:Uncharacterized protein n=1 Tax=Methylobacterium gnaphalii TaxID=1010610 RepID=A0A512JNG8_9HYPH|nr:hypothetical protein MGN01_33500 [Methylobacterium gnaphalii]GLS49509.1 hypothetical protein GCM10007885_23580 [Methylobacterium gnaphalii]